LNALVTALKLGGPDINREVDDAVSARGVNFRSPASEESLRQAGANDYTVRLVVAGTYRAPAGTNSPPHHHVSRVRSLYVDAPMELMADLRDELKKQLGGRFALADSVTVEAPGGGKISKAGRVLGIRTTPRFTP